MVNLEIVAMINKCSDENIYQLIHKLIDICCDLNVLDDRISRKMLIEDEEFVSLFVPSVWPTDSIFYEVCGYLVAQLCTFGGDFDYTIVDDNVHQVMLNCLELRQREMQKSISRKVIADGHNTLLNYDYNIKVVLSTDLVAQLKEPLFNLTLVMSNPHQLQRFSVEIDGENTPRQSVQIDPSQPSRDIISFEMTKTELASFIRKLEAARAALMAEVKGKEENEEEEDESKDQQLLKANSN